MWDGTIRGLKRKSFSPHKISVQSCDDIGNSEEAIDMGRPKREFFHLPSRMVDEFTAFLWQ